MRGVFLLVFKLVKFSVFVYIFFAIFGPHTAGLLSTDEIINFNARCCYLCKTNNEKILVDVLIFLKREKRTKKSFERLRRASRALMMARKVETSHTRLWKMHIL